MFPVHRFDIGMALNVPINDHHVSCHKGPAVMGSEFKERSASEYRKKFEEIRRRAEAASVDGDTASQRSYEKLAEGWSEMIKHAERRTGVRNSQLS